MFTGGHGVVHKDVLIKYLAIASYACVVSVDKGVSTVGMPTLLGTGTVQCERGSF